MGPNESQDSSDHLQTSHMQCIEYILDEFHLQEIFQMIAKYFSDVSAFLSVTLTPQLHFNSTDEDDEALHKYLATIRKILCK